jgi:hypothetical protein
LLVCDPYLSLHVDDRLLNLTVNANTPLIGGVRSHRRSSAQLVKERCLSSWTLPQSKIRIERTQNKILFAGPIQEIRKRRLSGDTVMSWRGFENNWSDHTRNGVH